MPTICCPEMNVEFTCLDLLLIMNLIITVETVESCTDQGSSQVEYRGPESEFFPFMKDSCTDTATAQGNLTGRRNTSVYFPFVAVLFSRQSKRLAKEGLLSLVIAQGTTKKSSQTEQSRPAASPTTPLHYPARSETFFHTSQPLQPISFS